MPPPPENLVGTLGLSNGSASSVPSGLRLCTLASRALLGRKDEPRIRHPERLEDVLAEIRVELLLAHRFNNASDPVDAGAIFPAHAWIEHQRGAGQFGPAGTRHGIEGGGITAELRVPEPVAEARRVREQVAQRDRALGRTQRWLAGLVEAVEHL